ncbi:hypothetical protein BKA82DRAFT_4096458 [Pisolithus tinctorius]|nr:hypothetical protein BKA82DRAFT_4096458 [Pisolithus tinctorius]
MMPMRASRSQQPSNASTVYTLSLLSEYTHTLDCLPFDLSRNFADLRELDAVLSSSMTSITTKIQKLTQVIEEGALSKQERLFLLTEIADEAARLRLGGEDKIRVACQAADNVNGHISYMRALISLVPSFKMSSLSRNTTYPHVAPRSYMPIMENSRGRRRNNYNSIMSTGHDTSPLKRKRNHRDDDVDIPSVKSPRKDRNGDLGSSRARNGIRSRRPERAASPSESIHSTMSHNITAVPQSHTTRSRAAGSSSRTGNSSSRRGRGHDEVPNGTSSRKDIFPPPSSTSAAPLLSTQYGSGTNGVHKYDASATHPNDWAAPPLHAQLEGPGVPVTRNAHTGLSMGPLTPNLPVNSRDAQSGSVPPDTATEAGECDGEGDDRTYCFCDGISYGEMIACDDANCEREWFHLTCIGLTVPPEGTWYCDACRAKQKNAKRGARGSRKRVTGGGNSRSGGRSAANS